MAFKNGHHPYGGAVKGRLKGVTPWNKGTMILVNKICQFCGEEFNVRKDQVKRGRGKYCSRECSNKVKIGKIHLDKRKRIIRICIQCNQPFEIRPCEEYRKFCSNECSVKYITGKKISPFTEEHKRKIGEANKLIPHLRGKLHPCWKNGLTSFYMVLRNLDEYKNWRMECLKRDWFRCQECFNKKELEVHHIKSFKVLVDNFLKNYSQFSIIDDRETLVRLATTYEPFWDINNGQTLCEKCHKSLKRINI